MSSNEDIRRGALLGGGTFGQVYRSEHKSFGLVAERVLPTLPSEQEEKVREAMKPLYRLRCDNATRLCGLVLQPGNYSLLMEYAQFGSVEELIKVKPPWAVRAKVMREVAMGLKYLHAHHVVHGNLSRHNVVISDDLVAKVTEFGLSEWRGLASNRQGGDTGDIADTLPVCAGPYAPPEAFTKCVSEALTCSFDIYSYGILSWEVITSEQAWKGLSPDELRGEVQKGARPVLRGGQHFPAACPLTMRNITTDAWGQQPANRPAMSDIVRRFVKKKDVQWSPDELRKAENEAKKKLQTDALRISTRARTSRHGAASAGLSSRQSTGLSPRGAGKTRHEERPHMTQASPRVSHSHSQVSTRVSQASTGVSQASPGVSQASPRGSQASPRGSQVSRHSTSLQAPGPPRKVTVPPGTKQGERKESQSVQKFKPRGSPVHDPEKTKSSKPRANGSGSVRKNASSSGSLKSAASGEEDVRKASTQATDSSQFSRSSRSSVQILTRDEGFSESSFTEDQMSQDGSQGEAGAGGGQSADVPATQAKAAVELAQVHLDLTEHPAIPRPDHENGSDAQAEAAEERSEITLFSQPDHQGSGFSTPPDPQADPSSQDASPDQHGETEDESDDEPAEPITSQYRGQLQPDLVLDVQSEGQQSDRTDLDVQPEEQQSTGTDVQSEEQQSPETDVQSEKQQSTETDVQSSEAGDTDSDEEQILSSVDSQDETSVKVPLGEQIETRESDAREEGGEENSTQQNDGSDVSTTPQESQTLPPAQTLQHQSQLLSHGGTDRLLNEAGPVAMPAVRHLPKSLWLEYCASPLYVADVSSPPYPVVIYYDESDPDIAEVRQVIQLLRRTWGLHVFDPHHDGVGDKMESFRDSFENCQHALAVLTPSVIRDMQDRRPNTASFRIATFLTGLLETRDEHVMNTCQRRLIPVQIGHDEIPFILCNFHVLRFGTSGFHRKLYRAVGSHTGQTTRELRRLADQMPRSEDTMHTVAAMLRLPPEVLTDIKQEFGGNRAMLIEILESWCLHHGACATDLRLQQVAAAVTGGQGSHARGQDQVQPAAPAGQGSCVRGQDQVQLAARGGQGSCVRGQDQVQPAAPAGQGSCARGQDQVQPAAPAGQGLCVRGQDQANQQFVVHQAPADIITLLKKNRVQLIEVLRHPAPVMDHLYSRDVITTEEMEIIKGYRGTPQDRARELLDIIASKGERGCTELKSALAEGKFYVTGFATLEKWCNPRALDTFTVDVQENLHFLFLHSEPFSVPLGKKSHDTTGTSGRPRMFKSRTFRRTPADRGYLKFESSTDQI
ncbi:hypothetical protein Bbelb_009980 [Branchiostoma belcheri]|nr:hypothetical protein Bbelb_009980 [Branchiostoma belcheri]